MSDRAASAACHPAPAATRRQTVLAGLGAGGCVLVDAVSHDPRLARGQSVSLSRLLKLAGLHTDIHRPVSGSVPVTEAGVSVVCGVIHDRSRAMRMASPHSPDHYHVVLSGDIPGVLVVLT